MLFNRRLQKTKVGSRFMNLLLRKNIYTTCGKCNESMTKLGMFGQMILSAFANIALPLIRRVHPQLLSQNIVGVQPMTGPIGLSFAMRYIYKGIEQFNELV